MIDITEEVFVKSLNEVAATPEGRIVLACLHNYCNFDGDIMAVGSPENTYANANLRRAYLYLRARIKTEHLKSIEFDHRRIKDDRPTTSANNDGTASGKRTGTTSRFGAKPKPAI